MESELCWVVTPLHACRKAYRLGKWLSDLNTLRNTPVLTKAGSLELLASGGEGVYYFVEQLTWYLPYIAAAVAMFLCARPSWFSKRCWHVCRGTTAGLSLLLLPSIWAVL